MVLAAQQPARIIASPSRGLKLRRDSPNDAEQPQQAQLVIGFNS